MELVKQVCTLEQAKRLKELGVKQCSIFAFYKNSILANTAGESDVFEDVYSIFQQPPIWYDEHLYSAFTVAELGEMLPDEYISGKVCRYKEFGCTLFRGGATTYGKLYETEAESRASMLIHLLEQKLITPEEINQRLSK